MFGKPSPAKHRKRSPTCGDRLSEQFRAYARQDSDLDAVRDDPAVMDPLANDESATPTDSARDAYARTV